MTNMSFVGSNQPIGNFGIAAGFLLASFNLGNATPRLHEATDRNLTTVMAQRTVSDGINLSLLSGNSDYAPVFAGADLEVVPKIDAVVQEIYLKLASAQVSLGQEFESVLNDHFMDLCIPA